MPESVTRSRLRQELSRVRDTAGLSQRDLGTALGVTYATINRDEHGPTLPPLPRVRKWLDRCGVTGAERDRILELADRARSETRPWSDLLAGPDDPQEALRKAAREATLVRGWQSALVPGVLQVSEYATAVLNVGWTVDVERAVTSRMQRQHDFRAPDATPHYYLIAEQVLRFPWAAPSVADVQRRRLLELADLDAVTVGVVPESALVAPAWHPFTMYSAGDGSVTVAHELINGSSEVSDPEGVERHETVWSRLLAVSVPLGDFDV